MKMPIEQRAKIFLPFSGVRGLEEALLRKREERLREDRIILSEDGERDISEALVKIRKGSKVEVTYYDGTRYRILSGVVMKKNIQQGFLTMENGPVIYFLDIRQIVIINDES